MSHLITSWQIRGWQPLPVRLAVILLAAAGGTSPAQIVLDGKFGTSGALSGPTYNITAAMGAVRGNNLFQSFAQFNLAAGEVANFTGPANIQNILSRVTGANPSSIDGTIHSGIAGANFFFINPKGIIFGPNAAIDVSGSFAASTADYLKLADGARFVASLDADDSGLSSAPVSAFGFLNSTPASITVQQNASSLPLAVPDGNTFSLVGGDISITGSGLDASSLPLPTLKAPGGKINLASVKSAGEVPVDPASQTVPQFSAAFPVQGQITLQAGAQIDASGDGGGRIVIRGGSLLVDNSVIQANSIGAGNGQGIDIALLGDLNLSNGGQINSLSTLGLGAGGSISLTANAIQLDGGGLVGNDGYPSTQISTTTGDVNNGGGAGQGGNILIHTGSLKMMNSAQISSATYGAGNAGSIDITASSIMLDALSSTVVQISANSQQNAGGVSGNAGDITIHTDTLNINNGSDILATTFGSGNAGHIEITANSVNLSGFGLITTATYGTGDGGSINVAADNLMVDSSFIQAVTTFNDPDPTLCKGGNISIDAGSIDIRNGGLISATTLGSGAGGLINLKANSISLKGDNGTSGLPTGINAASGQDFGGGFILAGTGNGGDISIQPKNPGALALTISDGAKISTATLGSGSGGNISVTARNLTLANHSSIESASTGTGLLDANGQPVLGGLAGGVSLNLNGSLWLAGGSKLSVSSAENDAGNVIVAAGGDITLKNSEITAQAALNGGNISLYAPDLIYLLRSPLTANANNGNGGVISLDPSFVILNDSPVTARVSVVGNGGQVLVTSDYFFASASPFDVTTPSGIPGTVTVTAPNVDLSGSLVALPDNLLDVETQLRPDCGVRLGGNISSFIVLGSGGLPVAPGGFVPSPVPAGANDKK
jgi:filamentous hemagglutinin family protein